VRLFDGIRNFDPESSQNLTSAISHIRASVNLCDSGSRTQYLPSSFDQAYSAQLPPKLSRYPPQRFHVDFSSANIRSDGGQTLGFRHSSQFLFGREDMGHQSASDIKESTGDFTSKATVPNGFQGEIPHSISRKARALSPDAH
jgi:hypothetical protein